MMKIPAGNFEELERSVFTALETYSNVHRGSGHFSMATTALFDQARDIVLDYLGLDKKTHVLLFCNSAKAAVLTSMLEPGCYTKVSSLETGLSLGVTALAVKRNSLPKGVPFQSGGGTARLIAPGWVIWASAPDRFEAGTPAIINIIAFAKALRMAGRQKNISFSPQIQEQKTAREILYHDELDAFSGAELLGKLKQSLIGRNVMVPTSHGMKTFVNFDHAASTPAFEAVWEAVKSTWKQPAEVQKEIVTKVKKICSGFLEAAPEEHEFIFTSNTTEAINLAAEKLAEEAGDGTSTVILSTILEHSSNDLPWRQQKGFSVVRLGVGDEGMLDLKQMESLLSEYNQEGKHGNQRIRLMAMTGASNVLGTFNDMEEIGAILHRYGARLLVDAAQMIAHRKVSMKSGNVDYLAFSAHKAYAPFGTGMLVVKKSIPGFSEAETIPVRTSGEENAAGIAALGKTMLLLQRAGLNLICEEELELTKHALKKLAQVKGLSVYGIIDPASPNIGRKGGVVVFQMKGKFPDRMAKELASRGGIGTRFGCHCAHIIIKHLLKFTPVLENIQRFIVLLIPKINLPGLIRISLGIGNTKEEIDAFALTMEEILNKPGISSADHKQNQSVPIKQVKQQMKEFTASVCARVYS